MRVLVAIAHHGTKNRAHLETLLASYATMPHDVDVVVLTETHKPLPAGVEQRVGLPSSNPWSLPFAHRELFAQRLEDYDLFVYSEDDTLVEARHVDAFVAVTELLPPDRVAGFLRYETWPDGTRSYCSIHSHYGWDPTSVVVHGGETFARFSNDHAACYLLTREQLRRAIASGGFLVEPHEGRYDMLVSAATDPYTRCGMERLVCVSRLEDFALAHLPNVYLGTFGIAPADLEVQCAVLDEIARGERPARRLLDPQTRIDDDRWDVQLYAPVDEALAAHVHPGDRVLSVGCGDGTLEVHLAARGASVVAIPVDDVIGAVAARRGVEVLPADLGEAVAALGHRRFDVVVLAMTLQHVERPVEVLAALRRVLVTGGRIVASVPNATHHHLRRRLGRPTTMPRRTATFRSSGMWVVDRSRAVGWLRAAGFEVASISYARSPRFARRFGRRGRILDRALGATLYAVGRSTS